MASKKKSSETGSLFMLPLPAAATLPITPAPLPLGEPALDLDELDDYDETEHVLRLADPPHPSPSVIVELVGDRFEVSRLRDNGTTVANVNWTRAELKELIMRAESALELK